MVIAVDTTLPSFLADLPSSEAASSEGERISAAVPESSGPPVGAVVGGAYRVVSVLGSGAMGLVLQAHDETLDRDVAIKFVHSHLLGSGFRERFRAEARAMARVSHPNVLQVFASGEHEGAPYFVMELVEGRTADAWLAQGTSPPDLDVALRILDETCQGVAAIHAAHTLHRDLKPSNILLDSDLRARVADLGLAVLCLEEHPSRPEMVGTPAYMAPEVAYSAEADPVLAPRADIYSLGCVAYELITGRPPFDATGHMGIMLQHATCPVVPPSERRPGLPPELDAVLLRALAKDPRQRTPTVEALRRELLAARRGNTEPVRILIAEDDDDFREALSVIMSLEFPEAEIEAVADGLLALEAFDRKRPSVTILDLRMPGLDGIELTGLLRARDSSASMPIIVLTASGGPDEWKRLSAMGADRFLVKPVILDDVVTMVRRSLGERSGSMAPAGRKRTSSHPGAESGSHPAVHVPPSSK